MEQQLDTVDRRSDLALVDRLVQEGRSQSEIEVALHGRDGKGTNIRETLRRLLGGTAKKAA